MFQKATKDKAKLRLCLGGVSGSGKTFTALKIATAMGGRIAVIDSEHGSASKYADQFDFDTVNIDSNYSPENYINVINAAVSEGYQILIADSISHAWSGTNGTLDQVEKWSQKNPRGDSFRAWGAVGTPLQNKFIDAILAAPIHIIATVRVKQEYAMVDGDRGKKAVVKLGLAPVQRDGIEYEFDVYGLLDEHSTITFPKTRCPELRDKAFEKPGVEVAAILTEWLSSGAPPPAKPPAIEDPDPLFPVPDPDPDNPPPPFEFGQELTGKNRFSEAMEKGLTLFIEAGLTEKELKAYFQADLSDSCLPTLRNAYAAAMKQSGQSKPSGAYLREALGTILDTKEGVAA